MWYRAGGNPPVPFHVKVLKSQSSLGVQGTFSDTIVWSFQTFNREELSVVHQKKEWPLQAVRQELELRDSKSIYGCSSQDLGYAFSLVT